MKAVATESAEPVDVVVVGQTPPPHHGQAVMIEALLGGDYDRVRLHHVRMAFSASLAEVGRFRPGKLVELVRVVRAIRRARARHGAEVLYYPPAGPHLVPILRDVALLLLVRGGFRRTVLHFHAGGVSERVARLPRPLRWLALRAYGGADTAIVLSERNPPDGLALGAARQVVVPYGVEDVAGRVAPPPDGAGSGAAGAAASPPTILYVGAVREAKGVLVLLEACRLLAGRGVPFRCRVVGGFYPAAFEVECRRLVADHELEDRIEFAGVLTGDAKWREYASADLFAFPTFWESETFGVVLLEAMQWRLPVVATDWRAAPGIVEDGATGLLVPPRDAAALADALERLVADPDLRRRMGARGRARYEERYTLERWRARMEELLAGGGE